MLSESGVHRTIVAFDRPRPCHSTRGRGDFAAANISPRAKLRSSNGEISFMVLLQLICSSGRIECQSDGQRNECLLLSDDLVCNKLRVCEARVQQRPTVDIRLVGATTCRFSCRLVNKLATSTSRLTPATELRQCRDSNATHPHFSLFMKTRMQLC